MHLSQALVRLAGTQLAASLMLGMVAVPARASQPASRTITDGDIRRWNAIRDARLTPNGRWFVYTLVPNVGDGVVVVRSTRDSVERRFDIGSVKNGGGHPQLSHTGNWLAFAVARPDSSTPKTVAAVHLETGQRLELPNVTSWSFNPHQGDWLLLQFGSAGTERPTAVVRDLANRTEMSLGTLSGFAWSHDGTRLVALSDSRLYAYDLRRRNRRILDSAPNIGYRHLAWAHDGRAVAALRATMSGPRDTSYAIIAVTAVDDPSPRVQVFADGVSGGLPDTMAISADRPLEWRRDGRGLFVGIRPKTRPIPPTDSSGASVVLWHWNATALPTAEEYYAERRARESYLSILWLDTGRIVPLASGTLPDVIVNESAEYLVGWDDRLHERDRNIDGVAGQDLYLVDARSGERQRVVTGLPKPALSASEPVLSPDGRTLLYQRNGLWHAVDVATRVDRDLTASLPADFFNRKGRRERLARATDAELQIAGWTRDGNAVLIATHFDTWLIPLRGGSATNLTVDGRARGIRYLRTVFPDAGDEFIGLLDEPLGPDRIVDPDRPIYFRTQDERTMRTGLARRVPGRAALEQLVWFDAHVQYRKARDVDVFVYSRETAVEFPDYYTTDGRFGLGRRLTDANPWQRALAWSPGARLLEYRTTAGDTARAILHLPVGYRAGQSYPTIVWIYEEQSDRFNRYVSPMNPEPGPWGSLNVDVEYYTRNGYAVLRPDIIPYRDDPGKAALEGTLDGVAAAVATGIVDRARLALIGHSYGGFETYFIVTQTNLFKAAIPQSGIVDLTSIDGHPYKLPDGRSWFFSTVATSGGQVYLTAPWWKTREVSARNSAILHVEQVQTPLLMFHGDADPACPFSQAVEFFSGLRGLRKPAVLLQYRGEGHELRRPENLRDWKRRELEFLDHFLKGASAPRWWNDGG